MNVSADGDFSDEEIFNILTAAQLDAAGGSNSGVEVNDDGTVDAPNVGGGVTFNSPYDLYRGVVNGTYGLGSTTDVSVVGATPGTFDRANNPSNNFAEHDGDSVTETGARLRITANNQLDVGLYAEGNDGEDLNYDEKVLVTNGEIDGQDVAFVGQDEGSYTFEFKAADTGVSGTADVTVEERDAGASFGQGTSTYGAGDIAEFNLTLSDNDETYVQIGSEDSNFVEVLYLKADDADEPMEVRFNTRLLGATGDVSQSDVYDTTNVDTIDSAIYSASADGASSSTGTDDDITLAGSLSANELYEDDGGFGPSSSADTYFEDYLDAMGIISTSNSETVADQLDRPLQSTDYEIQAAGYTGEDFVFDADPGGEANNQLGSRTLELTQPEIGDITVHTAPEASADDTSDVQELVDAATPRDTVAVNDRAVVQVEATGIYGSLVAGVPSSGNYDDVDGSDSGPQDVDFDILADGASTSRLSDIVNTRENIDFEVVAEADTGNQNALELALGSSSSDSDSFLVLDNDNGQFFLVVDTSSDSAFANGDAPDEATDFEAFMEYDADDGGNRYQFANSGSGDSGTASAPFSILNGGGSAYQNYPYLLQGETVSNSAPLTLEPRSIDYNNLNEDDLVQVANADGAEVSGTTNVAPGTDAEIRMQSTDASSSFRLGNDVNITEDGSITTTFDLGSQEVGDEFDANFRVEGSSTDTTGGVIVESVDTGDEEPETNETMDDGEEDMDDGEEQPADDGETNESTDDGTTDDGTPGFGAVVALIALIGAALLAVRRQN